MIKIRDRPGINLKILLVLLVLILGLVGFAFKVEGATGVPKIIHLQGRLLDANSNLLGGTSGTNYCFRLSIYTDATVGAPDTQLWPSSTPSSTTASVKNGVFNVGVGDTAAGGNTLDYNFQDNDTVYLNIEVATLVGATCAAGDGAESYENVSPRQQITSSGYAINASTVGGFTPSQYASGTQIAVLNSGNLSLGGTNPQINATGTNTLTLQGGGGTGNIQFFSASNTISSAGALTLAGAITTTGLTINTLTSGSLLFAGAGGAVSQSSTVLYWDNVNGRLGIGNNSPSSTLHITGTGRFSSALTLDNGLTLTTGALNLTATSGAVSLTLSSSTTAFNINGLFDVDTTNNRIGIGTTAPSTTLHVIGTITGTSLNASSAVLSGLTSGSLLFAGTGGAVSESSTVLYWDNVNGRLGIGTNAPSTTLDIIGAGRLNTTSTTAFQIQSSSTGLTFDSVNNRLGLGISTPSTPLHIVKSVSAFSATGGTITTSGIYTIHTFTTSGTFTPNGSIDTEVLVVAGGGGGGNLTGAYNTGGGGAGGIVYDSVHAVTAQAYTVTVGAGGAANTNGQDSVFDDITAIGGGHAATNGGSGGGNGGLATQGASGGEVGYGSNGGAGGSNGGGGGGGAGAAGQGNQGNGLGGVGGNGVAFSISGTSTYYGGGGGGNGSGNVPAGGLGGGGTGRTPTAGTANTGGGGGGYYTSGAAGGSGIVIIRYITPSENFTEGQRLGADTSNYGKFEIGQYGSLKISAVGTNPSITLTPGGTGFTILNGNVGIGTTSPLSTLHVSGTALFGPGTASTTAFRVISSSSLPVFNVDTINNRIGINTNSPSTTLDVIGAGRLNTTSTTAFQIQSSSTGLTFDSVNNRLGIGTASPSTTLHVVGTGRISTTSTAAFQIQSSSTGLTFDSHNNRLGIGTATPTTALDVIGTITATSLNASSAVLSGLTSGSLLFAGTGGAVSQSSTVLYWDNVNGKLGIGNNSPSSTLHVTGVADTVSFEVNSNETSSTRNVLMLRSDAASADDPVFRVTAGGATFADGAYTGTGADYAEWFVREGELQPRDVVGLNPSNGKARRYEKGDRLIGIYAEHSGFVGNQPTEKSNEEMSTDHALVSLVGQVSVANEQVKIRDNVVYTEDGAQLGYLLLSGKVLLAIDGKAGSPIFELSKNSPPNELHIALNDDGKFIIKNNSSTETVVSIDSFGNASFAGEIRAGSISANKISGLEIITDRISSLSNTVQDLVITEGNGSSTVSVKGGLTVKGDASFGEVRAMNIFAESIDSPSLDSLKESINRIASTTERIEQEAASSSQAIDALTARLDFLENQQRVSLDSSLAENGGLSIDEISIFKGGLQVNNISAVDNEIAFMSDVVFFGRPYFTTDTAGFGVILQGEKEVKVTFEKEYIEKPVVSATISLDEVVAGSSLEEMILSGDLHYIVTRVSIKGFTILIDKPAPTDIQFSWTALAVKNPKTFFSLKGEEPAAPTASEVSPESSSSTQIEVVSSSTEPIATPPESSAEASSSVEAPPVQTDSSSTETLPPPTIEEPSLPAPSEPLTDSSGTVSG